MNSGEQLSAGLKSQPNKISSFASTQAAWRFFQNEAISLQKLQEPLTLAAYDGVSAHCDNYALCVHDWSRLAYKHENKPDTYAITHATDVGYDLQTSLLISDRMGQPIAPVAQRLVSKDGSYATYQNDSGPSPDVKHHLDELTCCIKHLNQQGFSKRLVHIIDREADSIGHIRQWEAANCLWLTRSRSNSKLAYNGITKTGKQIANELEFKQTCEVCFHGEKQWQWVAEATVTLTRPAQPSQKKAKKPPVPGVPVNARLVVSRIVSVKGEILAEWLLITNVMDAPCNTVALWYYWRWKIESFFKLLKKAGHHLESWQQESALAIAKRLQVVSMACVTVWAIAADERPETIEFRDFLIKLSGRQMRHGVEFTYPALLAGLWVFLSMMEVLNTYSKNELDLFQSVFKRICGKDV